MTRRRHRAAALLATAFASLGGCRPLSAPVVGNAPVAAPALIAQGTLVPFATLDSVEAKDVASYRFTLPVLLRGHALQFLADHGATTTMLTDSTVKLARLPQRFANAIRVDTIVRRRNAPITLDTNATVIVSRGDSTFEYWGTFPPEVVDSIRVGSSLQRDVFIATDAPAASLRPADGLLGRDVLSQFDLEFDMPRRALRLYARAPQPVARASAWLPAGVTSADCTLAQVVPHMGIDSAEMDSTDMAETRHNPGKRAWDEEDLLLPLTVNGHAMSGTFDSGSGETILNWAAARTLGFDRKSANLTPMFGGPLTLFLFHASDGGNQDTTNYRAGGVTIQLGRRMLPRDSVLISDATFADFDDYLTKPLILVGLRHLRNNILFISYSSRQVCVS